MGMNIYTLSYEIYVFIISHHTKAMIRILPTVLGNMAQALYVCKILRLMLITRQYPHRHFIIPSFCLTFV